MSERMLQEIHNDVKEMRGQLVELIKQGAVNTQVLIEHERRSTNLEQRLEPIEKDAYLMRKVAVLLSSSSFLALVVALIKKSLY